MKKILGLVLTTSLGLSLGFSNSTLAEVSQGSMHSNLEVKEMQDGRIQGIDGASNLTHEQVNSFLEKMGFSGTEISNMQDSLKRDIIKGGGKKAILTPLKNENASYKSSVQYAAGEPELIMENGLSFNLFAIYEGTQGSNHIYKIYSNGIWSKIPYLKTTDTIGIFWGNNVTAVDNSDSARQQWLAEHEEWEATLKGDRSNTYGTQWKIPFKVGATLNGAYTSQKVSISTKFTGQEIQVGSAFGHPWLTKQQDNPFKFGPGTVDFNNVKGNNYTLKYNIIVGSK